VTSSQPVVTQNAINFTPDNKHCYAYSGEVSVSNTELFLLDFQTNTEYIVCQVQLGSAIRQAENYEFRIYFNNVVIFYHTFENQGSEFVTIPNAMPLIIPPFTAVKMSLDNITDTDSRIWTVGLTGRAYGMTETGYQ